MLALGDEGLLAGVSLESPAVAIKLPPRPPVTIKLPPTELLRAAAASLPSKELLRIGFPGVA